MQWVQVHVQSYQNHPIALNNSIIIEPHGGGVPEVILNDRSPRTSLPSCGLRPHSGRPAQGERSLSMTEGTPRRVVLFLLYPPSP